MSEFNQTLYRLIGKRLRNIREEKNLSQSDVSKEIGLGRTSISNIEKGKQKPPLHTLYKICYALDIDIHFILPAYSEVNEKISESKFSINDLLADNQIDDSLRSDILDIISK